MKILFWTGNLYYWNLTLLEKFKLIKSLNLFDWVEISCVNHRHKFSSEELDILKTFNTNTYHLGVFNKNEVDYCNYIIETLPNFSHFVLHPDIAIFEEIPNNLKGYISIENMDTAKKSYRTPNELRDLFEKYPELSFTFDINHCDENKIRRQDFLDIRTPNQIHLSTVNNSYYLDNPEIKTPHALTYLNKDFLLDINFNNPHLIVTFEWVVPYNNIESIINEYNFCKKILEKSI